MTQERKERALRMHWLREEVSRISNVTLAGTFANDDDSSTGSTVFAS